MKRYRIITAPKDRGKTTYVKKLIANDNNAIGFISEKDEKGYYLVNIVSLIKVPLLSLDAISDTNFRRWYVNDKAFKSAYEYFTHISSIESKSVYLDEVGMMEREGDGFSETLNFLKNKEITLTITVRAEYLDEIISHFSFLKDAEIINVPSFELE